MGIGSVALAFVAGVLTVLSPCVLPILPIVLGAAASERKYGPAALAAGLALSFVVVGLLVSTIGFSIGLNGEFDRSPLRRQFRRRLCGSILVGSSFRRCMEPVRRSDARRCLAVGCTGPRSTTGRAEHACIRPWRRAAAVDHRAPLARSDAALAEADFGARCTRESSRPHRRDCPGDLDTKLCLIYRDAGTRPGMTRSNPRVPIKTALAPIGLTEFVCDFDRSDPFGVVGHPRHCSHLTSPDLFISPARSRPPNRIFAKITVVTASAWTARSVAAASYA